MRFAIGDRLGAFEILAFVGAGGMGEVYRARDTRLDRTVAIKVFSSELASTTGRGADRFRLEARAISRITHPNICTLYDLAEDPPSLFLVMEYVDGATLAERLESSPLPRALALSVAIQIADALDYAHRQGIVHRDLKPGNIMLTRERVKLLDFGLARLQERDEQRPTHATASARLTEIGSVVGTLPYMAPEQIEGRDVDARTDIFAFGVVLYEMISGRRPFAGDSRAALMAAIVATDPPPLSSVQPPTAASLQRLILRALAKDPDERWQTARDLATGLRWIAETDSNAATVAPDRLRLRDRTGRWGPLAATLVTIAVVAAMLSAFWPRPVVAEHRQVTYRKGAVSSARFTPDGQSFVYSASWEGQPYATFLGRSESPDVRDLQLPDARILSVSRAGDMAMLFGPQNLARAFGVRTLARVPMAGGARRELLTGVMDADWIPGSDTLAVIRDTGGGQPWTIEFPLGTPVHKARAAWSLRVSPDGDRVAFFEGPLDVFDSAPESMITVIDKSGHTSTVARNLSGLGLAWAPSGHEIWFTAARPRQQSTGPQLHAVSLAGVERTVYTSPDWLVLHDISADGRVLLARNSIRINVVCGRTGETSERELGWLVASFADGLSADGQTLVFWDGLSGRTAAGNGTIYRRGTDGSPAVALGEARTGGLLSPDGRWVLAERDGSRVLLPTGAGATATLPRGEIVRAGGRAWLPDSKRIVFLGDTGDGKFKGYVQEIPSGLPHAFTGIGVAFGGPAAGRDESTVLGRVAEQWALLPIHGGDAQRVTALRAVDLPIQWSPDRRFLYAIDGTKRPGLPTVDVEIVRIDFATGTRVPWKTLAPADPVGVETLRPTVVMTPDAKSYCYSYMRRLGDLFTVDGLK
jgi:hypothetical protein